MTISAEAFRDVVLYYFTGTGNSYRAACWLAEAARERGMSAAVRAIDAAQPEKETAPGQLVGLLCPTHGFTAPWAMIRFALGLPRGQGRGAFVILTRAGMMAGRVMVQGLEGSGAYLLALILALKGYRVRGSLGLDMPGSWTVVMPGQSQAAAETILKRVKPRALAFFNAILDGGTCFKGIIELVVGLVLLPLSFMYLIMGRFFLAKLFYATSACSGCGLCERSCPEKAVKMKAGRPYWTLSCESCTRCMNFCPEKAVEASYPFGAFALWIGGFPVATYLFDQLARQVTQLAGLRGPVGDWFIDYPYKLIVLVVLYYFFAWLMRLRLVNQVLTFITPTRFYQRYREPGTRLGEITAKK